MKLKNYREIKGTLETFETTGQLIDLKFVINKNIEIPHGAIPIERLEKTKGKRISIFRLDDHYYLKLF